MLSKVIFGDDAGRNQPWFFTVICPGDELLTRHTGSADDGRRVRFIEQIVQRIVALGEETNAQMTAIDVVRRAHENSNQAVVEYTTLAPTPEQRKDADRRTAEFARIAEVVVAFLRRNQPSTAQAYLDAAVEFLTFIRWQRVNSNPDMPERTWRAIFGQEVEQLIDRQVRIIRDSADAFNLLRPRRSPEYSLFLVRVLKDTTNAVLRTEATSPLGSASEPLTTVHAADIGIFLANHTGENAAKRLGPRRMDAAIEFGTLLFDALVSGTVRDLYDQVLRERDPANVGGVRVMLDLSDAPELAPLPWELIYDGLDFVALSSSSSVVRRVHSRVSNAASSAVAPIRILVSVASPSDKPRIDVIEEQERLRDALAPLIALGVISLAFTPDGTARTLRRMLRIAVQAGQPYHVWHHIGHGHYSEAEMASVLYFEDDIGTSTSLGGFELATAFAGHPPLKLAVLNTCESGLGSGSESTAGVAVGLGRRGFSAVVAMQFPIPDEVGVVFAEEFYAALVDGLPVDVAVTEARRAVLLIPSYLEWAAPVVVVSEDQGPSFSLSSAIELMFADLSIGHERP